MTIGKREKQVIELRKQGRECKRKETKESVFYFFKPKVQVQNVIPKKRKGIASDCQRPATGFCVSPDLQARIMTGSYD
jgi:hypothetical protein